MYDEEIAQCQKEIVSILSEQRCSLEPHKSYLIRAISEMYRENIARKRGESVRLRSQTRKTAINLNNKSQALIYYIKAADRVDLTRIERNISRVRGERYSSIRRIDLLLNDLEELCLSCQKEIEIEVEGGAPPKDRVLYLTSHALEIFERLFNRAVLKTVDLDTTRENFASPDAFLICRIVQAIAPDVKATAVRGALRKAAGSQKPSVD